MLFRTCGLLLLAGFGVVLSGQTLPWYVVDHFPARSATAVPTNTTVLLFEQRSILDASYLNNIQYTLKSQSGTNVALKPPNGYYDSSSVTAISVTPAAPLAPSTRYTFTITPAPNLGDPYSFDFTTGPGPETTGPQITGFDPKSGASNTGSSGPFTVFFNKRLLPPAVLSGQAVSVTANGGATVQTQISVTADGMGMILRPQPQFGGYNFWPASYQITVDPSKAQDLFGNAGQGTPQSAQYTTFAATDIQGPVVNGFFPADGDSGLPHNISIRLLFNHPINTNTITAGVVLDSNGTTVATRINSFANGKIVLRTATALS
jgi:hypothetical protein